MSDKKFTVAAQIIMNSSNFKAGLRESQNSLKSWARTSRETVNSLKSAFNSLSGKLASIGLGFGAFELVKTAAHLEKRLSGIGINAGKSAGEIKKLHSVFASLSIKTGQSMDTLAEGFERVLQLTGSWDIAKSSIEAVNAAVTVTGASADTLAESLAVAKTSFGVDLSKGGSALDVLNRLAGIGEGAGGLSTVAGIFNKMGPLANLSGLDLSDSIDLIKAISEITKDPQQMENFTQQVLKLFTNTKAITKKGSMFGNLMFDENGKRRKPLDELKEIKKVYDSLNEKEQIGFISRLTGGVDAKSLKDVQMLLNSNTLNNVTHAESGNLLEKQSKILNNAEDQAKRIKNLMEEAGLKFAEPFNKMFVKMAQFGLDKTIPYLKDQKINTGDIAMGGITAFIAAWAGGSILKGEIGKFLSGKAGLGAGIGEGKALQMAAGVTPVYVVNFSEMGNSPLGNTGMGGSGIPPILKKLPRIGALAAGSLALPLTATALVGAGIYGAYRINQEQIKDRGTGFHPHELTEAEKYPLFNQGPSSPGEAAAAKHETFISVYIDGEKQKPAKTVIANRGHF